jgi:hypothetical protein
MTKNILVLFSWCKSTSETCSQLSNENNLVIPFIDFWPANIQQNKPNRWDPAGVSCLLTPFISRKCLFCPVLIHLLSFSRPNPTTCFLWLLLLPVLSHPLTFSWPKPTAYLLQPSLSHSLLQPLGLLLLVQEHGRGNFKDPNPLMSSLLVIFVWGGEAIL